MPMTPDGYCTCETFGRCDVCQPQREAEWARTGRGLSV